MTARDRRLTARSIAFALALAYAAVPVSAKQVWGRFTSVDSAELVWFVPESASAVPAPRYLVRVYGIDAPEIGQPQAEDATRFVRERLAEREGSIRFKHINGKGEMVARVFTGDRDLGLDLLRAGLAWRIPSSGYKPPAENVLDELRAAEREGREARRGIWSGAPPVAPWTFRGESADDLSDEAASGAALRVEGETDRNISKKTGNDAECAIAQNPIAPLELFAFCNSAGPGMLAARSTDGGATWSYSDPEDKTIVDGDADQGISACCDPSLAWDSFGNLFISYLRSAPIAVETLLSTDGGQTFTQLAALSANSSDQQTIVTADLTGGGHVVWVAWNQGGEMVASGASVTGLGAVGSWSAVQGTGSSGCSFGDVAVSPTGAVVQVCTLSSGETGGAISIYRDTDGLGVNGFGGVVVAGSTNVGGFDAIPAQPSRTVDPECGLAYDRNPSSPHFGRLYLVCTDELVQESNDIEVVVRTSDNDGATWSSPVRVNDDATTRSQFMPKIAADPDTGQVGICWLDARNSAANTAAELWCSVTQAVAAATPAFSKNVLLSDGSSTSSSSFDFGDYIAMSAAGLSGHPIWPDASNSTGENPDGTANFDCFTDRLILPIFADGLEIGAPSNWSFATP